MSQSRQAKRAAWKYLQKKFPEGNSWASYEAFCADASDRPSKSMTMEKIRFDELIGPDNFRWVTFHRNRRRPQFDYRTTEGRRAYDQWLCELNPDRYQNSNLMRSYGISIETYRDMLVAQNGVCAICARPETMVKNGKIVMLSVDHDHATGAVRGLLCNTCNRALGLFCDNPTYLESAQKYLHRHKRESNVISLVKSRG